MGPGKTSRYAATDHLQGNSSSSFAWGTTPRRNANMKKVKEQAKIEFVGEFAGSAAAARTGGSAGNKANAK